jgi:hypothetical protein
MDNGHEIFILSICPLGTCSFVEEKAEEREMVRYHLPRSLGEAMADILRIYPERPLIEMFLDGYEQGAALNWVEETEENAVEVIATRTDGKTLAIEHTLVELFKGEKYDSTIFIEAFESRIEKNPEFTVPGRALLALIKKRRNLNVGRDAIGGERSGTGRSSGCDDHKRRIAKGPMPRQASGV